MTHPGRARPALVSLGTLALLLLSALVAPGAAATDGRLAATGVDIIWIVVGAIAVVAIGVAAFLLSRRSRK